MANLLASLVSSAGSLEAYGRVLEATQTNVSNASTPGYAKQRITLEALPFDPNGGTTGGVRAGQMQDSRNEYSEQAVRRQTVALGYEQQNVNSLTALQAQFDISGNQGIPKALNSLLQSFSAWAAAPDSLATRQTVLQHATDLAQVFQQAASGLATQAQDTEQQIHQTVGHVNLLVGELQAYNKSAMAGNGNDSGLSSQMHATLEQLSQVADTTATFQSDGTVSVMLNGQTPLLIGDKQYTLSSGLYQPQQPPPINPSAPGNVQILASDGTDITSQTTGGQLGALLDVRNRVLPSYIGDAYQPGDLNRMAQQFADRVNQVLTAGNISDGPPPQAGVALFTYDTTNPTAAAQSLAVDPAVTPDQLAAIDPGPPGVSNGIPLALSQLTAPSSDTDKIDGVSYTQFYGQLAARVGSNLNQATNGVQVQQSLLTQSKDLRQQFSGVSLDEEATILIEFQRAYQATSKFISVLDQLTQTTIDLIK